MPSFASEWSSGFQADESNDWWHATGQGLQQLRGGFNTLREMTGAAIGNQATELAGQVGRHASERAAEAERQAMSSRAQTQLNTELGESDDFWGQFVLKSLGMVPPAVAAIGASTVGGLVAGPPGAIVAGTLANMGLNAGDVASGIYNEIDNASDEELLKNKDIFTRYNNGETMGEIRRSLKLELATIASAPTTAISAFTGPISAETGIGGFFSRAFRPTAGSSFLRSKGIGAVGGAIAEGGGEVLEEGSSAEGTNIAHGRYPNLVAEQDVGRAMREAGILGAATGGVAGGLVTRRIPSPPPPPAIEEDTGEAIDTSGVRIVQPGALPPDTAAAAAAATATKPPAPSPQPAQTGTLTSGPRPGIAVGIEPPNVTPGMTLADAPYEYQAQFLAQYGYTPEDLTGMNVPMEPGRSNVSMYDELNQRFQDYFIPDRIPVGGQGQIDPAIAAALSPPAPSVSPGTAAVEPPATAVAPPGQEAIPTGTGGPPVAATAPGPALYPRPLPRARDVPLSPPVEPTYGPPGPNSIPAIYNREPSPVVQEYAASLPAERGPMTLHTSLNRADQELIQIAREKAIAAAVNAEELQKAQRVEEAKAAGTYTEGYTKTSEATQAKRVDDATNARNVWETAQNDETNWDSIDDVRDRLSRILQEAIDKKITIPKRVRKGTSNELAWLTNVKNTLTALSKDVNAPERVLLRDDEAQARDKGNWLPMREKHKRKQVAEATYSEALGADETTGEGGGRAAGGYEETAAALPRGPAVAAPAYGFYRGTRKGSGVLRLGPGGVAPEYLAEAQAKLEKAKKKAETSVPEKKAKYLSPKQKAEQRKGETERAKPGEGDIATEVEVIQSPRQKIANRIKAASERLSTKKKPRTVKRGTVDLVLRRANAVKKAKAELKSLPDNANTVLYRAGMNKALEHLAKAGEALAGKPKEKDTATAVREIAAAEAIFTSTSEDFKGYRQYGKKPTQAEAHKPPKLTVIQGDADSRVDKPKRGSKRGRKRSRGRGYITERTAEDIAETTELTERRAERRPVPTKSIGSRNVLKAIRDRAARKAGPVAVTPTALGKPSRPFLARSAAMFRELDMARAAALADQIGMMKDNLRQLQRDIADLMLNGDKGEVIDRLRLLVSNAANSRETETGPHLTALANIQDLMAEINPDEPSLTPQSLEDFAEQRAAELEENKVPAPFTPPTPEKGGKGWRKVKAVQAKKYGRVLPDLSKAEVTEDLFPLQHVGSKPPVNPPPPELPPRTNMAEVRVPFTPEERAILKLLGYTDEQISKGGAKVRADLDDFRIVTPSVTLPETEGRGSPARKEKLDVDGVEVTPSFTMKVRDLVNVYGNSWLHTIDDVAARQVAVKIIDTIRRLDDKIGGLDVHSVSYDDMVNMGINSAAFYQYNRGNPRIFMYQHMDNNIRAQVFFHEMIHAVTSFALEANPQLRSRLEDLLKIMRQKSDRMYSGLEDIHEMLAEITDRDFMQFAKDTVIPRSVAVQFHLPTWRKATVWDAILQWLADTFGFNNREFTAFEALLSTFELQSHKFNPEARNMFFAKADGMLGVGPLALEQDIQFQRTDQMIDQWQAANKRRLSSVALDRAMEPATSVTMAKNALRSGVFSANKIDQILMKIRTNDSLMRAAEEHYPGLARKFHNLTMQRFTRAQELVGQDVDVQLERQKLYKQYKDVKIDGTSAEVFYNELLHDQSNRNIDAAKSLEDNDWFAKAKKPGDPDPFSVAKLHYPELRKRYEALAKKAPGLAKYMAKEWKYFAEKQRLLINTTIRNIVLATALDPDITPADALELGLKIINEEATPDDIAKVSEGVADLLQSAPELRERPGVYAPQLRFGDWVVNARVKVDAPTWANVYHQEELDGVNYDFYGPDEDAARAAANHYAAYTNDGKLRDEYSDNAAPRLVGPKGELKKADGTRWKTTDAGVQRVFRVHIQDRHTAFFENERDADDAVTKLKGDTFYAEVKGYTRKRAEPFSAQASATSHAMNQIIHQLDRRNVLAGMPDGARAQSMRALQEAMLGVAPGTSISKRRMMRRHVEGASKDAARAMHSYSVQVNNYIAAAELAPALDKAQKALTDASGNDYRANKRGPELVNNLVTRRWAQNGLHDNSSPFVNAVTSLVFVDKLVSIAYSVINGAQIYTNTLPRLTAEYGPGAARAIHKAMSDIHYGTVLKRGGSDTLKAMIGRVDKSANLIEYMMSSGKITKQERAMLEEMVLRGTLNADAGFEAGQVIVKGVPTKVLNYLETAGRQLPRAIDAGSRAVALLATYRMARQKGLTNDAAMNIAQDITDETQFNYSPVNSPPAYNTGFGRIALQFTRYPMAMYQFLGAHMAKALKGDKKSAGALLLTMGMYTLFSGLGGGGPWEPIRMVVTALNAMNIIDWDWGMVEATARDIASNMVGATAAEAVMRGLPRLIDVDTSSRITMAQLLFPPPQGDIQDTNGLFNYVTSFLLGPSGGFLKDAPSAINDMRNGHWASAGSKVLPVKWLSDTLKAGVGYTEGKRTAAGDVIVEFNLYNALIQSLGFTPGRVAEAAEFREAVYASQGYKQKQATQIKQSFWETPPAQRVRPGFIQQYRGMLNSYNAGLPARDRLTFQDLRNYAKDKDRRFSKSTAAVPRDRSTERLIEQMRQTYGQ